MIEIRPADGVPLLSLKVEPSSGGTVVHLSGELDLSTAPLLREALLDVLNESPRRIVLDLGELTYVDSTGLSLFVSATKRAQAARSKVVLRKPSVNTLRLLEITKLIDYFDWDDETTG